jgi:transcriptional regulator with XRE-family HTH domain
VRRRGDGSALSIPANDFADRLRRARERQHATAYALARATGLSRQGILNLEKPGADPKLSTILKLAQALGVGPWELLPGWPPSTPVDQAVSSQSSTAVDQGGGNGSSTPVDEEDERAESWVCTSEDTKRCMAPVWFNIQAAHDLALAADPGEAAAVLKYLLE